jgi:hypothetical protein
MNYLLIVFGKNLNEMSAIDICEKISVEEKINDIKYQVENDSIIVLFKSILSSKKLHSVFTPIFSEDGTIYVLMDNVNDVSSASIAKGVYQLFFDNKETDNNEEAGFEFEEVMDSDDDVDIILNPVKKFEERKLSLDEILDKITTKGMSSLTAEERKQLDNYSNNI